MKAIALYLCFYHKTLNKNLIMKKSLGYFILFTATALLMASCSGPTNMALTKRHYRSGYYVDWGGKKNAVTTPVVSKPSEKIESKASPINISKPETYIATNTSILIRARSTMPQITATAEHTLSLIHI